MPLALIGFWMFQSHAPSLSSNCIVGGAHPLRKDWRGLLRVIYSR